MNPTPTAAPPPFGTVNWQPPYSLADILGGSPPMQIDSATGELFAVPGSPGQFVFSITVYEYRAGVLIGEIKRDFQINVQSCPRNNPPEIVPPTGPNVSGDTLYFIAEQDNCFTIQVVDNNAPGFGIDSISIYGIGDIFDVGGAVNPPLATLADSGLSPLNAQLCWSPLCSQVGLESEIYLPAQDSWDCPPPHIVYDTFR